MIKSFLKHIREDQEYTSAATSQSQIAKGFGIVASRNGWTPGTVNVDLGGGRYDHGTQFMAKHGVTSHVLDPFNRSPEHNSSVVALVKKRGGADSVTVFNVLNTIKEPHIHREVLQAAHEHLRTGGALWLSVYAGDKSGIGRRTKSDSWQRNQGIKAYLDTVRGVFPNAVIKYGLIHATKK